MAALQFSGTRLALLVGCLVLAGTAVQAQDRFFQELNRFDAPEARQGVAVDADYFYPITNVGVAKYTKSTGTLVKRWETSDEHPLIHLNAGLIIDGELYCSHSNYPEYPETSSVEIWDTTSLEHIRTHSFGVTDGSLTWIDRYRGDWWAVFAYYSKHAGKGGRTRGTEWTRLVRFDKQWTPLESWLFPDEVTKRFDPMSNSGGAWGPDGLLYCTGHDYQEFYCLSLPKTGSVLRLVEVIPTPITGQAFVWDSADRDLIYGIDKPKRQVVVTRLMVTPSSE